MYVTNIAVSVTSMIVICVGYKHRWGQSKDFRFSKLNVFIELSNLQLACGTFVWWPDSADYSLERL